MVAKNLETIVVYTRAPWENALVKLRITGPAEQAGINVINGKDGASYHPGLVTQADLVVLQRDFSQHWKAYTDVLDLARANDIPVVFEMDDLLLDMPLDHSHRHEYVHALLPMLDALMRADIVTVSTRLIAEQVNSWNPNTQIIPNYLNDQIWDFKQMDKRPGNIEPLYIGYMGGETHLLDLQYISGVLIRILEKYTGRIRLRIWGGRPPDELLTSPYCEWMPINQLDYALFAKFFIEQDCDIFIAPLRDNPFNRSKSEIKFLEYSVHGIPGIYSRLPPYETIVIHGESGYLASTMNEWEEFLVKLIEHPELRLQMGANALNSVKQDWLLSQHYREWVDVYRSSFRKKSDKKTDDWHLMNLSRIIEQSVEYNLELFESVRASSEQVEEILGSRSWRFIEKFQKIRLKLLPPRGSRDRKKS